MKKVYLSFLLLSFFTLNGCDLAKNYTKIDREGDLEVQDYRDLFAPREAEDDEISNGDENIPPLMPYVAGVSESLKPMPLVSVNLNQSVPLRDALFELAKEAEYDLELDPNIRGSIIFTARNKPFDLVIKRIADVAGLRYSFEDDILRMEIDSPYSKTYKIDFLNVVRNSQSNISNDISVVSGDGADTGSNFTAGTTTESDFWTELEDNVSQILNVSGGYRSLRTARDPRMNITDPRPVPVEQTGTAGEEDLNANTGSQQEEQNPPQAVLQVDSLPLDEEEESSGGRGDDESGISFSINKQAGIILVYAPQKQHKEIESYLRTVKKTLTSQVLIEAKILEVTLNDEYAAGIAWNDLDLLGDGFLQFQSGDITDGVFGIARPALNPTVNPTTNLRIGIAGNDAAGVIDAVSRFGTVKALASPRLTVLNNQPAVLNVATNVVYFELEIDRTDGTDNTPPRTEVESEIKSVPEGVLINVVPSIDLENGTISMALRPTVTTIESFVNDPGIAFLFADTGLQSPVPQVNVQEIDSVINMTSGEAIVMGGLMQDRVESEQQGIPVMSELPIAGGLFRNQGDAIRKTELVIFLKATILNNGGQTIHDTDRDFYKKFAGDRRPFTM